MGKLESRSHAARIWEMWERDIGKGYEELGADAKYLRLVWRDAKYFRGTDLKCKRFCIC